MNTTLIIALLGIAIFLLIIVCTLCIIILKKPNNNNYTTFDAEFQSLEKKIFANKQDLSEQMRQEFSSSRVENSNSQGLQRQELNSSINVMSKTIAKMSEQNYEFNINLGEKISANLDTMRHENEQKLEQMRLTVDEKLSSTLSQRLDSSFKTVSDQLENVYKSLGEMKELSGGVTDNVSSLNRILTNVKARGTWAEVQLENLLDQTIPTMYDKNVKTNPKSNDIVEFAVKIPSSDDSSKITYVPIDSKFPIEDYIRLCSAADEGNKELVEKSRKSLEATVLKQAREVKKYINEPLTTPFAILYLATEGLYGEIISSKNAVAERCQNELGVMIAGPSTITALLNSLAIGFRSMAINEKAKEVRQILAAAKTQYEKFGEVLTKARKKIDEAGRSLDEAQNRNTLIQKKLKTVEVIEIKQADEVLAIEE
ncbi:MAG: DNA recombination protein RmuC [Clostridia bacterium]